MVDNIKLFVPRCRDMPDIGCYLDSGAVEKVNIKTGEVMIQGNVDNIKVSEVVIPTCPNIDQIYIVKVL